jgi:hypothetical protein
LSRQLTKEKLMGLVIAAVLWFIVVFGVLLLAGYFLTDGLSAGKTAAAFIITVVLVGSMTLLNWATTYRNDHVATCMVTDKDRGGSDSSYRVYTANCGQLSNEDSIIRGKFDSADLWEKIVPGQTCELRIAGSRWPFISQFPNVFDVKCVPA